MMNTALYLREQILKVPSRPIQQPVKLHDIKRGEVDIPESVSYFYEKFISGPNKIPSNIETARIDSLASDAVFSASHGQKKPSKHLLTMKTLTGSRKMQTFATDLDTVHLITLYVRLKMKWCLNVMPVV